MQFNAALPTAHRRQFRFSLRTFLIAVTVLSILLGTYIKQKRDEQLAVEKIKSWGATIQFDYQLPAGGRANRARTLVKDPISGAFRSTVANPSPPGPQWVRRLLGDHFFSDVIAVSIPYHSAANIDLRVLSPLKSLKWLGLSGTRTCDDDLRHLQRLGDLEELHLADSSVTDGGLHRLARLPHLRIVSLNGTVITDAGLVHLRRLNQLTHLELFDTHATDEAMDALQRALPDCEVTR